MNAKAKKKNVRNPAKIYQACPACKSKELIRLEVDVLCGDCDWMSCEEFVEMGGMDDLISAFHDHFAVDSENTADLVAESISRGKIELTMLEPIQEEELFEAEASA